jgi:hypothetical protein
MGRHDMKTDECRCERPEPTFRGVLRSGDEGEGLSLYCPGCGGWVEDAWLFTDADGIPVMVETETSQDYASGETLTFYGLSTVKATTLRNVQPSRTVPRATAHYEEPDL